jgi:hypothetical protein
MVNRIIGIPGEIAEIRFAVSSPFIPGIERSRITKWGFRSTSILRAVSPFSASPHTVQSVFDSIADRTYLRAGRLSSTIRILKGTALPFVQKIGSVFAGDS